jgi:hypothetical protein
MNTAKPFVKSKTLAALLCLTVAGCGAQQQTQPQTDLTSAGSRERNAVRGFYEAFTHRSLSSTELDQLTRELLKDRDQLTQEEFAEELKGLEDGAVRLRQDDPTDRALFFRHDVIQRAYFAPECADTLSRQLLLEPEPVLVADARVSRVMTRRDVIGFVNINNFSVATTEPHHRDLTEEQIALVADELNRSFGPKPVGDLMPQFYSESAAFWFGVRREWAGLSDHERELARLTRATPSR